MIFHCGLPLYCCSKRTATSRRAAYVSPSATSTALTPSFKMRRVCHPRVVSGKCFASACNKVTSWINDQALGSNTARQYSSRLYGRCISGGSISPPRPAPNSPLHEVSIYSRTFSAWGSAESARRALYDKQPHLSQIDTCVFYTAQYQPVVDPHLHHESKNTPTCLHAQRTPRSSYKA